MRQWLPHDLIAKEIFNLGYSSGASGPFEAWHDQLTNANDNNVVTKTMILQVFVFVLDFFA